MLIEGCISKGVYRCRALVLFIRSTERYSDQGWDGEGGASWPLLFSPESTTAPRPYPVLGGFSTTPYGAQSYPIASLGWYPRSWRSVKRQKRRQPISSSTYLVVVCSSTSRSAGVTDGMNSLRLVMSDFLPLSWWLQWMSVPTWPCFKVKAYSRPVAAGAGTLICCSLIDLLLRQETTAAYEDKLSQEVNHNNNNNQYAPPVRIPESGSLTFRL